MFHFFFFQNENVFSRKKTFRKISIYIDRYEKILSFDITILNTYQNFRKNQKSRNFRKKDFKRTINEGTWVEKDEKLIFLLLVRVRNFYFPISVDNPD